MTIENINIDQTIESVQKELKGDKSLQPGLVNSINLLVLIIKLLISRLGLNSSNSSLPPSSNNPRPTLPSGVSFSMGEDEVRQVLDIEMRLIVRKYRAKVLIASNGARFMAEFPSNVTKAIQYGPSVKSFAVYMPQYQLVPYNRVEEIFKDQFDIDISQGTLTNFNREADELLTPFETEMMKEREKSIVLNADETGININGELAWMHVLGIIPNYSGGLCHDHWKPYSGMIVCTPFVMPTTCENCSG